MLTENIAKIFAPRYLQNILFDVRDWCFCRDQGSKQNFYSSDNFLLHENYQIANSQIDNLNLFIDERVFFASL
jgi:hypothetical protein